MIVHCTSLEENRFMLSEIPLHKTKTQRRLAQILEKLDELEEFEFVCNAIRLMVKFTLKGISYEFLPSFQTVNYT